MKARRKSRSEAHVRLYRHELNCPAWRTLSPEARALLVELRALFKPTEGNIVFLSMRQAQQRLGIGQRRVQKAFDELIECGWIKVHTKGAFSRKVRHATSYELANEATASPGAVPSKDYMRWNPETE